MDKEYSIYIHTNTLNGKKYIGTTKANVKVRWNNGDGYKSQKDFYEDIQEIGWDNFSHEIIYENLTKIEADKLEKDLIDKYDTTNKNKGYNKRRGGVLPKKHLTPCGTLEVRTSLQVDESLLKQIDILAKRNHRSRSKEIIVAMKYYIQLHARQ